MQKRKNAALRRLCITGMMMALSVIIGIVCKNLFTWNVYYRVTFENFPIITVGFCFGPIWGMAAGIGADVISCLCSTNPAVNPLITAGAAAVGLLSGLWPVLFRKNRALPPFGVLAVSVASAHLVGQVLIKSYAKIVMFGMPWQGLFLGLAISVGVGLCEYFLIRFLLRNPEIQKILRGMTVYEL